MDKETMYRKLETALKKTLSPDSPYSDASVYVFDNGRDVFFRGHGEREYVALHRKKEIRHIRGTCGVIKPGEFGCILVEIWAGGDHGAEFRIKDGRIVRIDMYGNPYEATEWVERFVPAFSETMGGVGRFHD